MKILTWNVWGLNRVPIHHEIRSLIAQKNVSFVGLLETKVRSSNLLQVMNTIIPNNWMDHRNINHCSTARIWICWSPSIKVTILEESAFHIHCMITMLNENLLLTICYGDNTIQGQQQLWSSLTACAQYITSP